MDDLRCNSKSFSRTDLLAVLGLLLYFGCLVWLHYIQQHPDPSLTKDILNDLPDHIAMMDGVMLYSLGSLLLKPAYLLGGDWGVSVFLSLLQTITVLVASRIFRQLAPQATRGGSVLLSLGCCTAMAIYTGGYWYLGTVTGTIYHNTTFVYMELAALVTLLSFFEMYRSIQGKLSFKRWVLYTFCLTLTTAFKPSFFLVFAPALLLLLIRDLVVTRGKNLVNEVLVGCSTFPSAVIGLGQSLILFHTERDGSMVFLPFVVWKMYSQNIPADLIRSLLLILFVLFLCLMFRRQYKEFLPLPDRSAFFLLMLVMGVLECLLLAESGGRQEHANFFWSAHAAMMPCFLGATAALCQMTRNRKALRPAKAAPVLLTSGWIIYALHLFSGWGYLILRLVGQRPI